MNSIALFCEGVSESRILRHIIERVLGDEVAVAQLQPELTSEGKQDSYGGWAEVLRHCNESDVHNALAVNDCLVIQIDTDACREAFYGVADHDTEGKPLADSALYDNVRNRLLRDLSSDFLEQYGDRLVFAICINETECWLLPLYYENDKKKRCATHNCIYILNAAIGNDGAIPDKAKNSPKAVATYKKILKRLKRNNVETVARYNYGFHKFVEQLKTIAR